MSTPRFFVPAALQPSTTIELPEVAAHHAARVLRLHAGEAVTLFNGEGGEYAAVIAAIDKRGVTVEIGAHRAVEREAPLAATLVQAVSSGERMDVTIQKAVELGVGVIQPVLSERSVVRLAGERAEKRVAHWRQIVVSACEQCGRNRVPVVHPPVPFSSWIAGAPRAATRWLLWPEADRSLRELSKPPAPIELLVGPEGGLTQSEAQAARAAGFLAVRIGPRVLRTETAAPALLAAVQALWDDF